MGSVLVQAQKNPRQEHACSHRGLVPLLVCADRWQLHLLVYPHGHPPRRDRFNSCFTVWRRASCDATLPGMRV